MTSRHTFLLPGYGTSWPPTDPAGTEGPGFHLDSSLPGGRLGRYSYAGDDPSALLVGRRRTGKMTFDLELRTWRDPGGERHDPPAVRRWRGDPFNALRELRDVYHPGEPEGTFPFNGGLVGYFGYEAAYAVESLPDTGADDLGLPDLAFMVIDEVVVRDHQDEKTWVTRVRRGSAAEGDQRAEARALAVRGDSGDTPRFTEPYPLPRADRADLPADVRSHFDAAGYEAVVARCREHILAGDVFEVCPTQRLTMDLGVDPWIAYHALRRVTPAPFGAFLRLPGFAVACASPERFLRLDRDGVAESRPIKGTRPRGETPAEDARLRAELAASEKDRAENVMIVDLVRNDLGRVCEIGSVHVPELQVVEDYATVFQMVSTVRGRLLPDRDAFDLVRACFPGGSMTGAPKVAAMRIIDAVEPVKRGVYSGAIGYVDWSGAMDLNIVIRTLVCADGRATFGVGGAVTADSDPAAEYRETLDKARALIAAIRMANG